MDRAGGRKPSEIHAASVDLFLHQQGIDTTTPGGKAMFQMLGVFAEFERSMIQERVRAGPRAGQRGGQKSSAGLGYRLTWKQRDPDRSKDAREADRRERAQDSEARFGVGSGLIGAAYQPPFRRRKRSRVRRP